MVGLTDMRDIMALMDVAIVTCGTLAQVIIAGQR